MSNIIASIIKYTKNIWHNTDQDIVMAEHINAWENSIENMSIFLSRYAWHPNTAYPKGSVILFPFGLNTKLVSQNSGTSGYVEPTWSDASGTVGNRTINDNGIIWAEKPMEISSDTTPIGTIKQQLWHTAPPGYLKLDASVLLSRTEYPELWEFVQNYTPLISETDWQIQKAKQNTVAYFSTGDGSTNFRTPVILDFARGGSVTSVGVYSADQNKKHSHNAGELTINIPDHYHLAGSYNIGNNNGNFYAVPSKQIPKPFPGFGNIYWNGDGHSGHYSSTHLNGEQSTDAMHPIANTTGQTVKAQINESGGDEVLVKNIIMPYFLRTKNI